MGVTFAITYIIGGTGILFFVIKMIISGALPLLAIFAIYHKSDEFNYFMDIL